MNVRLRKRRGRVAGSARRFVAISIIACWLSSGVPQAFSLNSQGVEYPVKLAFLYNFTKFIEWPPGSYRDPGASLAICIFGRDRSVRLSRAIYESGSSGNIRSLS